jgi:hypothetical protein
VKELVVLEDPTLDQYIVKPILEKMFDTLSQTVGGHRKPELSGPGAEKLT